MLVALSARAAEPLPVATIERQTPVDFGSEIVPILRRNCVACHNATKAESDLSLETVESMLADGGLTGPAVVPGKSGESPLLKFAAHREEPIMPPANNAAGAKNLTPEELGLLALWIDQGAKPGDWKPGEQAAWRTLPASFQPIYAADVTPDGRYAAAGRGNQVAIYALATKQEIGRLDDPALQATGLYPGQSVADLDAIQSLAFSPDGSRIATGGFRTVRLWKRLDGAVRREFAVTDANVLAVAFSADGRLAAPVGTDGSLRLIDLAAGAESTTFARRDGTARAAAFSPDDETLFVAEDGAVVLLSIDDGRELARLSHAVPVKSLAMASDGQRLLAGGVDGVIRVWEAPANAPATPVVELSGHGAPVVALAALPTDANSILSISHDGSARLWNVGAKSQTRQFDQGSPLVALAVSPDGKRMATAAANGAAVLWDVETGARIAELSSDSDAKFADEARRHAIEVARLRERTAKNDLDEAIKRAADESTVADGFEIAAAEAKVAAKKKATDAEKPVAEKDAAENTLAEATTAFDAAEAAKTDAMKARVAASEALAAARSQRDAGTADEATVKAAEEAERVTVAAEQTAVAAAAEATKKRDEAKREADRLRPIAQKAIDERNYADGYVVSSAREAIVSREIVAKTASGTPAQRETLTAIAEARRAREVDLAAAIVDVSTRAARLRERDSALATTLREALALQARVRAENPAPGELAPETVAAQQGATERLAAARTAMEAALLVAWTADDETRKTVDRATIAKSAADDSASRAAESAKARVANKEAADKALADAKTQLDQAPDEDAKGVKRVAHQIAERNAAAAAKASEEAVAAQAAADAAKAEAERALEAAKAERVRRNEEANGALSAAREAHGKARAELNQADAAAGPLALAATAERLLAEARDGLAKERSALTDLAFSRDGSSIALSDASGNVFLFAAETGEPLQRFSTRPEAIAGIDFAEDGALLVASATGSIATRESVPVWRLERTIGSSDSTAAFVDRATAAEFSPDGALLATGGGEPSRSGELKLWTVETGELARDFAGAHSDAVLGVSFSSDGALLASCGADRFLKVFDATTGAPVRSFEGHTHHVLAADWRADDRLLVTGSADATIKIWDLARGEQIRTIQGLAKEAPSAEFLGATEDFAVAIGDAAPAIRNTGGGSGPTFAGPIDFTYVVRATPDGKLVIAGGQDGTLRVWDRSGKPLAEFPASGSP